MWQSQKPVLQMETGLAFPVFSAVSNASGRCEGKGGHVKDHLGKSTEKEGSQEKFDLYVYPYVHHGVVRLIRKSIILKKHLGIESNILSFHPRFQKQMKRFSIL